MSEKDLLRKESTLDRREQKLRALDSELDERVAAVKVSEGKLWRAERRLKELEKTLEYRERVLRRQETSLQKREKELIDNADVETSAGGGEAETSFTKLYKESTKSRDSEERNSLNEQKEQLRLKELRLGKLEKELKKKEEDLKKRETACLSTSEAVETAMDVGDENQIAEKHDSDGKQDSEMEQDSGKPADSIQEKPDSEEKQDSEETQDNEKKTGSEEKLDLEENQDSEDKVERENPSNIPEADSVQPGTNNDSSVAKKVTSRNRLIFIVFDHYCYFVFSISFAIYLLPDYFLSCTQYNVRHCSLVGSAPAWDGTGCEFDSWQCRRYIPCSLSLRLLGSLQGSLGFIILHMA